MRDAMETSTNRIPLREPETGYKQVTVKKEANGSLCGASPRATAHLHSGGKNDCGPVLAKLGLSGFRNSGRPSYATGRLNTKVLPWPSSLSA